MNAEQLNAARLARWSQNGEARLTLEAAAEWLGTIGFCPYLPTGVTGAAPAPSFLEAVVGRPAQVPSAGERSRANELLARMIENSAAVPLKLGHSLGEQPDFVASPEVLRYIYALRGDRNFKAGPSTVGNDKVTPLALHCWQAIEQQGALDVAALQPILGRDITEAAIARALQELWIGLYVFPVLSATGKAAKWELLSRRFPEQVTAGASTGQAESLSAMVSLYLNAVVAAAEEEVLAYLSPLAPQSKLREVIRGLGSMRQLDMIDIGGRAHVCLQGGLLPEMVAQLSEEQLAVSAVEAEGATSETSTEGVFEGGIEIEREPLQAQHARPGLRGDLDKVKKFVPKKFVPRSSDTGESAGKRFGVRASGPGGQGRFLGSRSSGGRYDGAAPSSPRSFAASAGDSTSPGGRGPAARKPSTRGIGERAGRWEKSGEGVGRPAGGDRKFGRKPSFKPSGFKSAGSGPPKPWASKVPRSSGEASKPWAKRASFGSGGGAPRERDVEERPKRWQKAGEGPGASGSGYKKPYTKKPSGFKSAESKPWGAKSGGRKPSGFTASGFKSAGARSREGEVPGSKPWVSRGAESRVGSAKSYAARTSRTSDGAAPRRPGKPYEGAEGAKPWKKKRAGFERAGPKNVDSGRGGAGDKSKRWEKADAASGSKPGEKRNAKPFWAKNPRGGKGSVAASRTNRPRGGKKSGGKKSGKKK